MYQIKLEHQLVNRWFKADSYTDAMELFHLLTKTCHHVQVWHGDKLTADYQA